MNSFLLCPGEIPTFLIFDFSTAPKLLFYSYAPIVAVSLFLSVYILIKDRFSNISKLLFYFSMVFILWVINILVQWVSSYNSALMFGWQITAILEVLIPILTFVFYFKLSEGGKMPKSFSGLFYSSILVTAILTPTKLNVQSYDYLNCEGNLGPLLYFIYSFELVLGFYILVESLLKYAKVKKARDLFLGLGAFIFLLVFSLSNIFGEYFQTYEINLIGPLGMVGFLGLLTYSMVKFKTFNAKLIGANVLVVILWILTASLLFVQDISIIQYVVLATLIISVLFGFMLIRSVRREVAQREKIGELAVKLSAANEGLAVANEKLQELDKAKTEFVSIAAHQLRAPLTAIKGYSSMLLEGSFGPVEAKAKGAVDVIFQSSERLVKVIEDFLNITRIELGRMKYDITEFDFSKMVTQVVGELKHMADRKNLSVALTIEPNNNYMIKSDYGKLGEVVSNLVDNAIKYSDRGTIVVKVEKHDGKIRFSVKDHGVGIDKATMANLFQKFTRATSASQSNASGTGLGLYVAKQIIEGLKGKIWAESSGVGQGSTFLVELAN